MSSEVRESQSQFHTNRTTKWTGERKNASAGCKLGMERSFIICGAGRNAVQNLGDDAMTPNAFCVRIVFVRSPLFLSQPWKSGTICSASLSMAIAAIMFHLAKTISQYEVKKRIMLVEDKRQYRDSNVTSLVQGQYVQTRRVKGIA